MNATMDEEFERLRAFEDAIKPWLSHLVEQLATDKSNDWSVELSELHEITGDPDHMPF